MSEVLKVPHKKLYMISEECKFDGKVSYQDIASKVVLQFANLNNAKGLAAVQCGFLYRLIVIKPKHDRAITVMCNPAIEKSYFNLKSNEGCESCKDRWIIKRPSIGKVKWYDIDGKVHTKWFGRDAMRIISHEIDHLNGLLICDRGEHWVYSGIYNNMKGGRK